MESESANPKYELAHGQVRAWALEAGFAEAGLAALPHAHAARDADRYAAWLAAGHGATMGYLEQADDDGRLLRARVAIPFPWARSAVVCFANYNAAQPRSVDDAPAGAGWIARYAWSSRVDERGARRPSDYHKVLRKRVNALEARIRAEIASQAATARVGAGAAAFEARGFVDTGPVMERALATAAGLGWTGKNTCLIHPRLGSYGFLAVLLTSLDVAAEALPSTLPDRCGTCVRCIQACPTEALTAPYRMDASRCISYLTIEHKGAIDETLAAGMGRQIFGCDICQDVCPWNRKSPISLDAELAAREELVNPALQALAEMNDAEFEARFNGSPVRRAGFAGFRRNIAIAMGNSRLKRFRPALAAWAEAGDEGLRRAAQWALARLS